jgi:hypothetical protein
MRGGESKDFALYKQETMRLVCHMSTTAAFVCDCCFDVAADMKEARAAVMRVCLTSRMKPETHAHRDSHNPTSKKPSKFKTASYATRSDTLAIQASRTFTLVRVRKAADATSFIGERHAPEVINHSAWICAESNTRSDLAHGSEVRILFR